MVIIPPSCAARRYHIPAIEQAMAALKVPEAERQKYLDFLERQ